MAYENIRPLTTAQKNSAIRMVYENYSPEDATLGWDSMALSGTNDFFASLNTLFIVNLKKGATYDIVSSSYFDPTQLALYDSSGNAVKVDEGQGESGVDIIYHFVPEYTGDYYVDASWRGGGGSLGYVWLAVAEDIDTIPGAGLTYGTAGIDTATLKGARAGYSFQLDGEHVTLIQRGQEDKKYVGVERFRFDDISIATDINGNAGKAYRLYEAAFDRKPDASGLGFWVNGLDHGISLLSIANSFLGSNEFKSRYGDQISQKEYVTALYLNVLNRAPDQAGADYWVDALNAGSSRAQILVNFSESIENQQGVIGAIQNGMEYQFFA